MPNANRGDGIDYGVNARQCQDHSAVVQTMVSRQDSAKTIKCNAKTMAMARAQNACIDAQNPQVTLEDFEKMELKNLMLAR